MKNIKNKDFNLNDIENSQKILFSLFTRYGDTIIDLVVIKEFIQTFSNKQYLILCPKQMIPYVNTILPNIETIGINKRNLFHMISIHRRLKNEHFDIGFNPWSNGLDSCFFISYCKKFVCYKDFNKPTPINHYEVVRLYLKLPKKVFEIEELKLAKEYNKILICPQSTDNYRSINIDDLKILIQNLQFRYKNALITIAAMDEKYLMKPYQHYCFEKTYASSQNFIELMNEHNLCICVDSAPLHLANTLKKDCLGIFNITNYEYVINTQSKIMISKNKEITDHDFF